MVNSDIERRYDIEGAVFEGWKEDRERGSPFRPFLGASDLGSECFRKAWYKYHHVAKPELTGKLYRRFDRGHREEPVIAEELRRIGVGITIDNDGKQIQFTAFGGHVRVHLDGMAKVPIQIFPNGDVHNEHEIMFVEMKTMSLKLFKTLSSKGVKEVCPGYYRQMQTQWLVIKEVQQERCHITGGLFYAVCKDTDEIYVEVVRYDKEEQDLIRSQIELILRGEAPDRIDVAPQSPPCRFCDFKMICRDHSSELIERNCRTCDYAVKVFDLRGFDDLNGLSDTLWRCDAGRDFGTPCDQWTHNMRF